MPAEKDIEFKIGITSKNAVKSVMKYANYTQRKLADELGVEVTNITGILNRHNTMKVSSLVQMVEAMGFEVIVRNKQNNDRFFKITDGKQ